MAYSSFRNLKKVVEKYDLKIESKVLFEEKSIISIEASDWLKKSMDLANLLGFYTEKERSERLVHPILAELVSHNNAEITLYSGQELNVDKDLTGECDYLMTIGHKVIDYVSSPVFSVVEAKRQDMEHGTAQCTAQMIGAIRYNLIDNIELPYLYGATTDGQKWRFLKLQQQHLTIHPTYYYLSDLPLLLGIFNHLISDCRQFKI